MTITRMRWGGRSVRALILAIFASVLLHTGLSRRHGNDHGGELRPRLGACPPIRAGRVDGARRASARYHPAELADLGKQYPKLRAERMDVADEAQVRELAGKLKTVPIDVLINNAANTSTGEKQRFGQLDFKEGEDVLSTNILGPLRVSEAFLPQIEAGRQKKIVSITSTHASLTQPLSGSGAIFYRASKAGLNRAMLAVSEDLKPKGITVVLVHPGSVRKSRDEPATSAYGERVMVDVIAGTLIRTVGGGGGGGGGGAYPWRIPVILFSTTAKHCPGECW